jgi:GINS complex subunit 1
MHGKRATDLLEELRKSTFVPPYNDNGVRLVAAEIKELLEPLLEIVQSHRAELATNQSYGAGVLVYHRSIQRNKRCVLAYLMNRLRRIQAYRWEAGNVAAAHLADNMSAPESHFLNQYNKILGTYCDQVELDLTAEAQPPKDLYIEVRVIKDCGAVVTDSGNVTLKPGTAHFLKRTDVEHLIRQGALEHII